MKTITIEGKRYTLSMPATSDGRVFVQGPGLPRGIHLPAGVTLDSPDLAEQLAKALADSRVIRPMFPFGCRGWGGLGLYCRLRAVASFLAPTAQMTCMARLGFACSLLSVGSGANGNLYREIISPSPKSFIRPRLGNCIL